LAQNTMVLHVVLFANAVVRCMPWSSIEPTSLSVVAPIAYISILVAFKALYNNAVSIKRFAIV
jgi:hypothetical protein